MSSSGHLILVPWLFDWTFFLENPELNKTFDVALHVGTFVGTLAYFWRDVLRYLAAWIRSIRRRRVDGTDERLAWLLVIGTIPSVITGIALEGFIERNLGDPWLIATMLATFGVLLFAVDRWARQQRRLGDLRVRDTLLIGAAQALALSPGVSRSGVTITAARALGMHREDATRFSFLLALPVIAGASLYEMADLLSEGLPPGTAGPFLWGTVASAVSGFAVIWALLAYVRRRTFTPFVWYRLAVAGLAFALIATGVRTAAL